MNKLFFILFLILFSACSPVYNFRTNESRIVIDKNDEKHYINDRFHFSAGFLYDDGNYQISNQLSKRDKRILKQTGYTNKDTILYIGRGSLFLIKRKDADIKKFRVINLYDSIFSSVPYNQWVHNFYRKSIIDPKHKTFIINDLIPLENNYFQRIEYLETDYNCLIDPTNVDDLMNFSADYKEKIELAKYSYHSILQKKTIEIENPFELLNNYFVADTLFNYQSAILAENKANNYYLPQDKGFFNQMLATYYSFAGNTQKADSVWYSFSNTKDTCNCQLTGTYDDLLRIISQNQVVMFNEAHHVPSHRLLLYNLLDSVYNQGFRYLALEAFAGDSLFNKTGYVSADNGFYLREPIYANLVRKAYQLGFTVFGYDAMTAERDKIQAENIYNQTINQDVSAKVIVLAGWGHIDKNNMAGEFEKISGIKPLTIDQTIAYNKCFKSDKQSEVYLFQPNDNQHSINADLYIFNNLELHSAGKTNITIPDNIKDFCSIICIYGKKEFEWIRSKDRTPIPVAIINPNGTNELNGNLPIGEYIIVFQDNYGTILDKNVLSITN
jgi:hypothetical protein